MKKNITALLIFLTSLSFKTSAHEVPGKTLTVPTEVNKWFGAWEMVCKKIYRVDSLKAVEFVFFDAKYIYSTSNISVPAGEIIDGPSLLGKRFTWKRKEHEGKITLPTEQIVPVGLMSFASPLENENAFFVMPLLSFWEAAGVKSKELGLELLVTGVFLHEFSHSQQMQNFGKKMTWYEQHNKFTVDFSDDIVQDYFEKDSIYELQFRKETSRFYEAASDKADLSLLTGQALGMHNARQEKYFTGDLEIFKEIDNFFLTMEGLGQYTMYAWLVHPEGANIPAEIAQKAVRRGGKSWSQEEGLSLFLVLSKISVPANWSGLMFGNETISVIDLIKKGTGKK